MNERQSERPAEAERPGRERDRGAPSQPQIDPSEVIAAVSEFARENPHVAIGGALAVGFLLGGGLTPRILGAVGMVAARRYFAASLRETLEAVVRDQMSGDGAPEGQGFGI